MVLVTICPPALDQHHLHRFAYRAHPHNHSSQGESLLQNTMQDAVVNVSSAREDRVSTDKSAQRSFAQPAACLHVPAVLTREATKREARKRRANQRHAVGCSEELGGGRHCKHTDSFVS